MISTQIHHFCGPEVFHAVIIVTIETLRYVIDVFGSSPVFFKLKDLPFVRMSVGFYFFVSNQRYVLFVLFLFVFCSFSSFNLRIKE